jgi:acyl carrier protein
LAQKLEWILRAHARFIATGTAINPDMSLTSLGVDSLGILQMIVQIEDEFDLEIPPEQITPETFSTPASIWQLLCKIDPKLAESQLSPR